MSEKVKYIEVEKLVPYENNARVHTPEQIEMIGQSLKDFGFINPIIIDENNVILAGHGRVEAAKAIGLEKVPYIRVEHLTDDQKRAYVLVDNKMFDLGKWDYDVLHQEVEALDVDMTKYGYEEFLTTDYTSGDEVTNEIEEGKELDLGDYSDDSFEFKCPNCQFTFNRRK